MKDIILKRCPFCGADAMDENGDQKIVIVNENDWYCYKTSDNRYNPDINYVMWKVTCRLCSVSTCFYNKKIDAINAWNGRVDDK